VSLALPPESGRQIGVVGQRRRSPQVILRNCRDGERSEQLTSTQAEVLTNGPDL
jgi:hypothetical protein